MVDVVAGAVFIRQGAETLGPESNRPYTFRVFREWVSLHKEENR